MRVSPFITLAMRALSGNRLRSFLTMLGIIIGIAAIVIIIAVGNGAQSLIVNQVNSLGTNLIGVLPGGSDEEGPPATAMGISITSLKYDDAIAMRDKIRALDGVVPHVRGVAAVSWNEQVVDSQFSGVSADYPSVETAPIASGYFFTEQDDAGLARVVVLGSEVARDLFGETDPLGQSIRIKKQSFRVIAVLAKRGTVAFQNQDAEVFVPVHTALKVLLGQDHLGFIRARMREGSKSEVVVQEVRSLLRERHELIGDTPDDFSVRTVTQMLDVLGTVTNVLKYFLAAISALGLLVGGIGIMNIMLVAVLERTREIGLRKAVGARPYHLRLQFLAETITICLVGGIVGFIIGVCVAYLIAMVAQYLGYAWDFSIGWVPPVIAVTFPIMIGIVFGYYPAQQASKLVPVEALHYE